MIHVSGPYRAPFIIAPTNLLPPDTVAVNDSPRFVRGEDIEFLIDPPPGGGRLLISVRDRRLEGEEGVVLESWVPSGPGPVRVVILGEKTDLLPANIYFYSILHEYEAPGGRVRKEIAAGSFQVADRPGAPALRQLGSPGYVPDAPPIIPFPVSPD